MEEQMREGDVLAGKYRIGQTLGRGAMGVVVAAEHLLLKEPVAIKLMTCERLDQAIERFLQEARAARKLRSEHVVRVIDVGTRDDGVPYIVMERLEGVDLAAHIARSGRVAIADAIDWVVEACDAVAEAHSKGIVHRDLKPANLFLVHRAGADPIIKVLDFGISKHSLTTQTLDAGSTVPSPGITEPRAILGSPFYMSPEQMDSARGVDAQTDIWSLGVTLFELVSGALPFTGANLLQVYKSMISDGPPTWPAKLAMLERSTELEPVFAKCWAVDRRLRYRDVGELALALAPFGSKRSQEYARRIARIEAGAERGERPSPSPETTGTVASVRAGRSGVSSRLRQAVLFGTGAAILTASVAVGVAIRPMIGSSAAAPAPLAEHAATHFDPPAAPPSATSSPIAPSGAPTAQPKSVASSNLADEHSPKALILSATHTSNTNPLAAGGRPVSPSAAPTAMTAPQASSPAASAAPVASEASAHPASSASSANPDYIFETRH
jgi:serine/threonine-protein kinase